MKCYGRHSLSPSVDMELGVAYTLQGKERLKQNKTKQKQRERNRTKTGLRPALALDLAVTRVKKSLYC